MIKRKEILHSVMIGKTALDNGNGDIGYLRFLINKMTYELAYGVLANDLEK